MSAATKPLPLYERVKHHLLARIAAGEWKEGARLPSEHDLMAALGASRMTVHRALREMSAAGVLRRVQGVGTFIKPAEPPAALIEITDIADDIAARGNLHATRVIALEAIAAGTVLAAEFSLRRGAKIFHSVIVHSENEIQVQLEERFVLPRMAPGYLAQDFTRQTTHRYLAGIAPFMSVEHVIRAIRPDGDARKLLDIAPGEPCLQLRCRCFTQAGAAIVSLLTHPGSRYSLRGGRRLAGQDAK